jgi:hypothetical protein
MAYTVAEFAGHLAHRPILTWLALGLYVLGFVLPAGWLCESPLGLRSPTNHCTAAKRRDGQEGIYASLTPVDVKQQLSGYKRMLIPVAE